MTIRDDFEAWAVSNGHHVKGCYWTAELNDLWAAWQAATERAALICEERSGPLPGVGAYSALLAAADAIRGA